MSIWTDLAVRLATQKFQSLLHMVFSFILNDAIQFTHTKLYKKEKNNFKTLPVGNWWYHTLILENISFVFFTIFRNLQNIVGLKIYFLHSSIAVIVEKK